MTSLSLTASKGRTLLMSLLILARQRLAADLRRTSVRTAACGRKLLALLSRAALAISRMRPPVSHAAYARIIDCLRQVEDQTIAVARGIEDQAKRLQAFLDIARTAHGLDRDTGPSLTAALEVLDDGRYWNRKQNRVFLATRQSCTLAKLANASDQRTLATAAYLKAQQFNHLVVDVDRRIGLAVELADVAAHLKVSFDQSAWLTVAMELASGIREPKERLSAVNFVARHMVRSQIPPTDDNAADRRFSVESRPPKRTQSVVIENGTEVAATVMAMATEDDIQFNIIG